MMKIFLQKKRRIHVLDFPIRFGAFCVRCLLGIMLVVMD